MKALITGTEGQDAPYLAKHLIDTGKYEVFCTHHRSSDMKFHGLEYLDIIDKVTLVEMDLLEYENIRYVMNDIKPNAVYNLAAMSHVGTSFKMPTLTFDINARGVLYLLEALRATSGDKAYFYQASSSKMFGKVNNNGAQNENSPFHPRSPYGVSKLAAYWITVNYRESYNMFCCNGILYNHESPLRGLNFVTRKITNTLAKIFYGQKTPLTLGNLDAKRDWGHAWDHTNAMYMMMHYYRPGDYVVGTGVTTSIREFLTKALHFFFKENKLKWEGKGLDEKCLLDGSTIVEINPEFYRPAEVDYLRADATKIRNIGWEPKINLDGLVKRMCSHDKQLVRQS